MSDLRAFAEIEARRLVLQMSAAGVKFHDYHWAIVYLSDALADAFEHVNNWDKLEIIDALSPPGIQPR